MTLTIKTFFPYLTLDLTVTYLFLGLSLAGCGSDSIQDNLNQQRDHQRVTNAALATDYKHVVGQYSTLSSQDTSIYFILGDISLTYVQRSGGLVPQPSLTGSFRLFNKDSLDTTKIASLSQHQLDPSCAIVDDPKKCGYVFAFSDSVYDSGPKIFAAHIEGIGVTGADVSCTNTSPNIMTCRWQPVSGGAGGFDFTLQRTQ